MNSGRTVFSQVMDFLPMREFRRCVARYRGHYKVQSFTCLDQFLSMAFAQLTYRESLRDIEVCLRAMRSKLYHMGFRGKVSKSTLADANEKRDWRIWADWAEVLIAEARGLLCRGGSRAAPGANRLRAGLHHDRPVPVSLSLGALSQAQGRGETAYAARCTGKHTHSRRGDAWQGARRQHPRRDPDGARLHLRDGARLCGLRPPVRHPSNLGALRDPRQKGIGFPTSLFSSGGQKHRPDLRSDHRPSRALFKKSYPEKPRRIRYVDPETGKRFIFLSNNFVLPALSIDKLYKYGWRIELFFKWLKQHLRIKSFFGTSDNAVKTQVIIAISVYVLVAIIKKRLDLDRSLYTILQILSVSLFEKSPILQALTGSDDENENNPNPNQLELF